MNKIFATNLLICIIYLVIVGKCYAGFTYEKCDESLLKGNINWINVSDCDPATIDRCNFRRGTNVTITINFVSRESTAGLKVKIYGNILGIQVPWRVNPDNACSYGVVCPIQTNSENTFLLSMPISRAYPSIPVKVKLRLEDSRKRPYFCVEFPVQITD